MNCKRTEDLINEYLNNELSDIEMAEMKAHLETCASCKKMAEEFAHVRALLQYSPAVTTKTDIRQNVLEMIEKDNEKFIKKRFSLAKWINYGSMVAIIMLCIAFFVPRDFSPQENRKTLKTPVSADSTINGFSVTMVAPDSDTAAVKDTTEHAPKYEQRALKQTKSTKKGKGKMPETFSKQVAQTPIAANDVIAPDVVNTKNVAEYFTYEMMKDSGLVDGKDGKDGRDRKDGINGKDPAKLHDTIGSMGSQQVPIGVVGAVGAVGPAGPQGPAGPVGATGATVTIEKADLLMSVNTVAETYIFSAENYAKYNNKKSVKLRMAEPITLTVDTPKDGKIEFTIEPIELQSNNKALVQIYYPKEKKDALLPLLLEKNIITPQNKK